MPIAAASFQEKACNPGINGSNAALK
jgi:hypothetical protein